MVTYDDIEVLYCSRENESAPWKQVARVESKCYKELSSFGDTLRVGSFYHDSNDRVVDMYKSGDEPSRFVENVKNHSVSGTDIDRINYGIRNGLDRQKRTIMERDTFRMTQPLEKKSFKM